MARSITFTQQSPITIIFFILGFAAYFTAATYVTVGAGTVPKDRKTDSCSDVQEFACVNNVCDPCSFKINKCRYLDDKTHCLEKTFCEPMRHFMPGAASQFPAGLDGGAPDYTAGVPKHFRCVQVSDYTGGNIFVYGGDGQSCFIEDEGVFATPGDVLSNVVDTSFYNANRPSAPCRRSGQAA